MYLGRVRSVISHHDRKPIADEFARLGMVDARKLSRTLHAAISEYNRHFKPKDLSFTEHQEQMRSVAYSASTLLRALPDDNELLTILKDNSTQAAQDSGEYEHDEMYGIPEEEIERIWEECDAEWATFKKMLIHIQAESHRLSRDPDALRMHRGDPPVSKKSPEHLCLWLPIFELWSASGGKVRYSEKGPIVRILTKFHSALKLPPPKLGAVRQAIRDFQKRGVSSA